MLKPIWPYVWPDTSLIGNILDAHGAQCHSSASVKIIQNGSPDQAPAETTELAAHCRPLSPNRTFFQSNQANPATLIAAVWDTDAAHQLDTAAAASS
eukprot:3933866-Rhodomonas_salina.1